MIRKLYISILCVAILFCCAACNASSESPAVDDSYLEGMERGYEDVFLNLWEASPNLHLIHPEETWDTASFSLTLHTGSDDWGETVGIDFISLRNSVIECFEEQEILLNVYSYNGNGFDAILYDGLFYMHATLEYFEGNVARATIHTYEDTQSIAILIVADGIVYRAVYDLNK